MSNIASIAKNQINRSGVGGGGGNMETRLAIVETKVDGLSVRMDKLDKRMDGLEVKMDNLTKEMRDGFNNIYKEMSGQSRWMAGIAIGIVSANVAVGIALATYLKQPAPQTTTQQPQVIYLQPVPNTPSP